MLKLGSKIALIAFAALLLDSGSAVAKGNANRSPASLQGCQISRKGTKIRCPQGMYIRADVVERKIASEKSGKATSKTKKKKKNHSSRR